MALFENMININIWSNNYAKIEEKHYQIQNKGDMIIFLNDLLDKVYYSGEIICLETVEIKENKNCYTEIERWNIKVCQKCGNLIKGK